MTGALTAVLNGATMPRYTIPRTAHCGRTCEGGALAMAEAMPVEILLADLPQVQKFLASVNALLRTLAESPDLPEPVMAAVGRLLGDAAALARDTMPSDEDRIRDAMAEARDHPGRTITR